MIRFTFYVSRSKSSLSFRVFLKNTTYLSRIAFTSVLFFSYSSPLPAKEIPLFSYEVINTYPHDPAAFTQGLIFKEGYLFESTGNYGHSSLRKVDLESGKVLQIRKNDAGIFAEGLTDFKAQLFQLSWKAGVAFQYGMKSFDLVKSFHYSGEGWGLTRLGDQLIMSDGSSNLRFLDPATFKESRRISVTRYGRPVKYLNELEMVKGEIYANVWRSNQIVIISPKDGQVTGVIDLSGLLKPHSYRNRVDVLNGIAYDPEKERLFVTGKYWPWLFEIRIVPE